MSRELCDVKPPVVNILGAVNEIFQVLMLSSAPNTPKISVSFKNKGQTCQNGLHLFCLKVSCSGSVPMISFIEENCFPQLCEIISEMQTREPESHLALQLVNENNSGLQKTMLLWLEANTASCVTVNILSEALANTNMVDGTSTVLELRTLITISHAVQCGKEILDLLQRIKLLNPKVQMLFTLCTLTLVEFDLCDTNSISCGAFDIYHGQDLFLGKSAAHFICQTAKVKCSRRYELKKKDGTTGAADLTCIACYVPICAAPKAHTGAESFNDDCSQKQEIRGHLRIQVYGPASLPFDMKAITKKLMLSPHSLLPWQKLGLQVKKSFSCSSYDMHCSAKITQRECVPSWAAQCQHFYIVLAFTVNEREDFPEDNVFYRLYRHQELFRDLEQQTLNTTVYSTFQEAAWSSLEGLLSQDKQKSKSVKCKQNNITDVQVDDMELFKKMIPEVANSLTDIFTRSTCTEFRSKVGALVQTSSRSSLSSHLETSLWKVICQSRNNSENPVTPDQTIIHPEESRIDTIINSKERFVDDWDFSEDSLLSEEDCKAWSPDSLDLDWDNAQLTALCEDTTSENDTKPHSDDAECRVPEQPSNTDKASSCSFQQFSGLSPSFDSCLSPEQEFDQWEMPGGFLNSSPADTCTSNTEITNTCLSSGFQPATTEHQYFHLVPSAEDLQLSAQICRREHISSATNSTDQTTRTMTAASTAPKSGYMDKLPRKRSSEYIDDDASVGLDLISSDDLSQTDDIVDSKKQRCQNYDSTCVHSLSHQQLPITCCLDEQDSCVKSKSGLKELDHNEEETHLKLPNQVEGDTFSNCWFDEEDVANWYAELDK